MVWTISYLGKRKYGASRGNSGNRIRKKYGAFATTMTDRQFKAMRRCKKPITRKRISYYKRKR